MIAYSRKFLLLLIATTTGLVAIDVQYGDGFTLTTTDGAYFTVSPGAGNAGMTSDGTDTTSTIFQLLTYFGGDTGGTVTYGAQMSIQLPANKLWVTLNPPTEVYPSLPYVRNNAPQPLVWEQLYFVYVDGANGTTLQYGDQVYVGRTDQAGYQSFLYTSTDGTMVNTVSTTHDATVFTIESGSLTPYNPPNSGTPVYSSNTSPNFFTIQCGDSYNFTMTPFVDNAGDGIDLTSMSPTSFIAYAASGGSTSNPLVYGQPVFFGSTPAPLTMTPAPGRIRSNALSGGGVGIGVWEELYFISVNGRNGDTMYFGDQVYIARNGLISGYFATEYVTVDMTDPALAMITTTTVFADATPLTFNQISG